MKQQQQKDGGSIYGGAPRSIHFAIPSRWAITVRESDVILGSTFSFPRRTNRLSEIVCRTRAFDDCRSVTGGSHQVSSAGILVPPTPFEYGSITNPLWSFFYIL